jgi:hypothetical protein
LKASALIAAYLGTDYWVFGAAEPLRVGEKSAWLAYEYDRHDVQSAVFITGFNPYSVPASAAENSLAQARLRQRLATCGARILDGEGRSRRGDWPPEPSFLALGITLDDAHALGREFGQNAFVMASADAVPALVWLTSVAVSDSLVR